MRALLTDINTSLQALPAITSYITMDEDWIPADVKIPCVGVKDGGAIQGDLTCGVKELTATVCLVGFARVSPQDGEGIIGDDGIFSLLDVVTDHLVATQATVAGCQGVEVVRDLPSGLIQTENGQWIAKLVRHLVYVVQR